MSQLFVSSFNPALTVEGLPAPGAKMAFYLVETNTLADVFDVDGNAISQAANSFGTVGVEADSSGRFPQIYFGTEDAYRVVLRTAEGVEIGYEVSSYENIGKIVDDLVIAHEIFDGISVVETMADAKASNILASNPNAQYINIVERGCNFQRWAAPLGTLPDTLADYAWFEDAGGHFWMLPPGSASVTNFGAVGNDSTADTRGFFAAAAWASSGFCHNLVIPNLGRDYLLKTGDLSWYPTGAAKTEMTSMAGFAGTNCGIAFIGIEGLTIIGEGWPTVKRADDGCTLNTFSWLSWGVFNFKSCTSPTILGFTIDCNRLGQFYTSGLPTFTDVNHGLYFYGDCQKPTVKFMDFYNTGTLRTSSDKAGDGIYMSSGTKDRLITYCKFYTMGRMAITMERPRPNTGTDDSTTQSYRDEISHYYIDNGFKQDGAVALAGIDYEPWSAYGYVEIAHGIHRGTASKISMGSAPNSALQIVRQIHIHDLTFDLVGSTAAHSSDVLIAMAAGWTNPSLGLSATVRIFEGATLENIDVYSDKKLGGHITSFQTAVFRDLTIRNIRNHTRDTTVNIVSCISFTNVWLEGVIDIDRNQTGQVTHGVHFNSFQDPTTYGYTPDKTKIIVRNNIGNGTARGIRGTLPAFTSGSSIVIDGNRFLDQTSQSDPNASTMTGVSGNTAKVLDTNYFSGTGNSFTGFTTPGRGNATITSGNSSVTVTHGLGYTPTDIILTQKGTPVTGLTCSYDTVGATTFVIKTPSSVGTDTVFSWRAVGAGGL